MAISSVAEFLLILIAGFPEVENYLIPTTDLGIMFMYLWFIVKNMRVVSGLLIIIACLMSY
jgi:hypothetical protein